MERTSVKAQSALLDVDDYIHNLHEHTCIYIYGHISHLHTITVWYTRKELPDWSVSNCSRPSIFDLELLADEFPENKVHHGLGCFTRTYEDNLYISIFTHN
jgi:hypothetical protein